MHEMGDLSRCDRTGGSGHELAEKMTGLPENFEGVIQDTASTATLCAVLSAREKSTGFRINNEGLNNSAHMRVYCSAEAHSSVEKAVKIAGIGRNNLVKIDLDEAFRMKPDLLEEAILSDIRKRLHPVCVVAALVQPAPLLWIRLMKLRKYAGSMISGCMWTQLMPVLH